MPRMLWLLALLPCLAQAQIYQWTDERGRVHFAAQPGHSKAQAIEVKPQVVERDTLTREREQRLEKFYDARRDEREQAQQQAQELRQQRLRECQSLREQLAGISRGGNYFYRDDQGERRYYSDQQMGAARSRLSERIAQRCG